MTGEIGVDSGMILCIDPCLLFTRAEWDKIMDKLPENASDEEAEAAILKALEATLKRRKILHRKVGLAAAIFHTPGGDGTFQPRSMPVYGDGSNGIVIEEV